MRIHLYWSQSVASKLCGQFDGEACNRTALDPVHAVADPVKAHAKGYPEEFDVLFRLRLDDKPFCLVGWHDEPESDAAMPWLSAWYNPMRDGLVIWRRARTLDVPRLDLVGQHMMSLTQLHIRRHHLINAGLLDH